MTSSSMGVQLTPGQRCLLDLLQRKLLKTIQVYAKLSLERRDSDSREEIESELEKLKEKIRRISARQKRFTLEIINGNGNNTIPKECFFRALGLVTKEALSKLNSKTNERRRRTTANPRFSHEAIQAKKALEPLQQKRVESRVRDRREPAASKKPQRQQQSNNNNNNDSGAALNIKSISTTNTNSTSGGTNTGSTTTTTNNGTRGACNQQALNNNNNNIVASNATTTVKSNSRTPSSRNRNLVLQNERREILSQLDEVRKRINLKAGQIKDKQASNLRLELQNELIRKRGLDFISAMNIINPNLTFQEESTQLTSNKHNNIVDDIDTHTTATTATINNTTTTTTTANSQIDHTIQQAEPLDIWIDMKCDESLDGLD